MPDDVVFFDADDADGAINHIGICLGIDSSEKNRVLPGRNVLLGSALKESASGTGPSILDGSGWMQARSAGRL